MFTLETRRERIALVNVLSSFGVGEQKGWIQALQRYTGTAPKALEIKEV